MNTHPYFPSVVKRILGLTREEQLKILSQTPMTTEQRIKNIFMDLFGIEDSELVPEASNNDLQLDSLDKVELLMNIEKEFGLSITDQEADGCKQFSDYVLLIESKLKQS